jgi:hypothetical protein
VCVLTLRQSGSREAAALLVDVLIADLDGIRKVGLASAEQTHALLEAALAMPAVQRMPKLLTTLQQARHTMRALADASAHLAASRPDGETKLLRMCRKCSRTPRTDEHGALEKFQACSACKRAYYCSRACQRADWPSHKNECKAHREATRCTQAEHGGSAADHPRVGASVGNGKSIDLLTTDFLSAQLDVLLAMGSTQQIAPSRLVVYLDYTEQRARNGTFPSVRVFDGVAADCLRQDGLAVDRRRHDGPAAAAQGTAERAGLSALSWWNEQTAATLQQYESKRRECRSAADSRLQLIYAVYFIPSTAQEGVLSAGRWTATESDSARVLEWRASAAFEAALPSLCQRAEQLKPRDRTDEQLEPGARSDGQVHSSARADELLQPSVRTDELLEPSAQTDRRGVGQRDADMHRDDDLCGLDVSELDEPPATSVSASRPAGPSSAASGSRSERGNEEEDDLSWLVSAAIERQEKDEHAQKAGWPFGQWPLLPWPLVVLLLGVAMAIAVSGLADTS